MSLAQRIGAAIVTAALSAAAGPACMASPAAAGARPSVDESLLEFLGSADPAADPAQADGGAWLAYLSKNRIVTTPKTGPGAIASATAAHRAAGAGKNTVTAAQSHDSL